MKKRNLKGKEVIAMNRTIRLILILVTALSVLGSACSRVDARPAQGPMLIRGFSLTPGDEAKTLGSRATPVPGSDLR